MKIRIFTFCISLLVFNSARSQNTYDYASMMDDGTTSFTQIQQTFNNVWQGRDHKVKGKGWKAFKRWEYIHQNRLSQNGKIRNNAVQNYEEYKKFFGGNTQALHKTGSGVQTMAAGTWNYIGVASGISANGGTGRTTFLRFDPFNTTIMYAGTPAGGLWKSTNGGTSWSVLADQFASIGCSDLAIDPANSNIMYLATGDADGKDTYSIGILKSTDGGITWNATGLMYNVSQNYTINRLLIDPVNSQILYAATSSGLMKTIDGGVNWYLAKSGVYRDIEFKPFHSNTIYASSSASFFISKDAGISWTLVPTNFPGAVGRAALAVTPADSNYIYILGGKPAAGTADDYGYAGIVRSTNGGQSFTLMSTTPNIMGWNTNGSDDGGQAWYDIALAASPVNANTIFTGGINIWKSTNGGTTMTNVSSWSWGNYVHADQHALEFLPGTSTLYAGNDGGVYKTTNAGSSWTDLSNGLQIAQQYNLGVSQTNAALTLTGHQDNGTNLTNGTACSEVLGADGFECIVSWQSASVMYGEAYYGDISKSTNGGTSWSNVVSSGGSGVDEDGAWNTPYIQHPTNANTLLVGKSQVYRSTNAGSSWTQVGSISGNGNLSRLAYAPSNPNYIYVTDGGGLWVSTNGTSFVNKGSSLPAANITGFAIDPANPSIVYISSSGYSSGNKVFVTTDAGNTWQNYSAGLPNVPCNHIVFQDGTNDALYLATDIGVFYRDSSMSSWINYSYGMPNVVVTELEIQVSTGKLRAATYGRGLWETDLYSAPTAAPAAAFTANAFKGCTSKQIDFYDLSTNLPTSWNWTFTGGTPASSAVQFPTVSYAAAGTYAVKLVVSNGIGSDSVEVNSYITVHPNPTADAGADVTICSGDTVQLQASGGNVFLWGTANTLSNLFVSNPMAYPTSTKTYNVTVSDSNGCKDQDFVLVTVLVPFANPSISANGNLLTASPSGANLQYQWYLNGNIIIGANSQTLTADSSGSYSVVVTDNTGCFSKTAALTYVGIGEKDGLQDWNIFPNPSKGLVNITAGSFSGQTSISVFSAEGKLVAKEMKSFKQGENYQLRYELSDGMFMLELKDSEGKTIGSRKLIVVKD